MTEVIHVHEDDCGLRTLHPCRAAAQVEADMAEGQAAGQRNRTPGGWTDVHLIQAPDYGYAEAGLRLEPVAAALGALLPRVRHFRATATSGFTPGVVDPYGFYQDDAWCFGSPSRFFKLNHHDGLIREIWFDWWGEKELLELALRAVDGCCESIVADYCLDMAGRIRDADFLSTYLRQFDPESDDD